MTLMAFMVVSMMNLLRHTDRTVLQVQTSQKPQCSKPVKSMRKNSMASDSYFEDWEMSIEKCTYDVRAYLPGCVDTESINIGVTSKQECIQYNPSTGIISYKPTKKSMICFLRAMRLIQNCHL